MATLAQALLAGACSAVLVVGTAPAHAARAHVHGEGDLSIAVENGQVDLALIAPAADVRSDEDDSDDAMAARYGKADLFVLADATCQLTASSVVLADEEVSWAESGEHEEPAAHDDHDEEHSDYLLTWSYQCSTDPDRLSVELFDLTSLVLIRVQALGESGVATAELSPDDREVELP
jgi:hypothetical protein